MFVEAFFALVIDWLSTTHCKTPPSSYLYLSRIEDTRMINCGNEMKLYHQVSSASYEKLFRFAKGYSPKKNVIENSVGEMRFRSRIFRGLIITSHM
ncbi:hypothetical protein F5884DRAFT_760403 [Xylogone sp. PMI_703]|nr:hypothetical protein F5884DRAFT_760403 [Xylogone sp. PMI_703]